MIALQKAIHVLQRRYACHIVLHITAIVRTVQTWKICILLGLQEWVILNGKCFFVVNKRRIFFSWTMTSRVAMETCVETLVIFCERVRVRHFRRTGCVRHHDLEFWIGGGGVRLRAEGCGIYREN